MINSGQVRYLVLLLDCGGQYPPDLDEENRDSIRFRVGLGSKYKPSKEAVVTAFRSHGSQTYTGTGFYDERGVVLIRGQ